VYAACSASADGRRPGGWSARARVAAAK
jgi:hypothetical protein